MYMLFIMEFTGKGSKNAKKKKYTADCIQKQKLRKTGLIIKKKKKERDGEHIRRQPKIIIK